MIINYQVAINRNEWGVVVAAVVVEVAIVKANLDVTWPDMTIISSQIILIKEINNEAKKNWKNRNSLCHCRLRFSCGQWTVDEEQFGP